MTIKANGYSLGILLFFLTKLTVHAQTTLSTALKEFNTKYDTTVYFKKLPFLEKNVYTKFNNIISINKVLSQHDHVLLKYSDNQYVVVPSDFSNETLASLARNKSLDASIEKAKQSELPDTYVLDDGSSKREKQLNVTLMLIDDETKLPMIGANVEISSNNLHYTTDVDGKIKVQLSPSAYKAVINYVGYEERVVDLLLKSSGTLTLPIRQASVALSEVLVTEKAEANLRSPIVGLQQLSMKQIKKLPSLMGQTDILKSLVILPGVSTNSDGVGGISVRGGNADQNLILLDDISYYNPNHALGFLSSFNPDFINGVSLYKGYIPPRYGGRIAAVLSSDTRSPNNKKWVRRIGLGLSNSSVSAEGPIVKEKTSIALGGRLSHANWMIKLINDPASRKSRMDFYDYQARLEHKLSRSNAIGVSIYNGYDAVNLLGEAAFSYTTKNAQAYFRQAIGTHTNINAKYSKSSYNSSLNDLLSKNPIYLITGIDNDNAKINATSLVKETEFNYGIEYNKVKIVPAFFATTAKANASRKEEVRDVSLYGEVKKDLTSNLTINMGARYVRFSSVGARKLFLYGEGTISKENIIDSVFYNSGQKISSFNYVEPRISLNYRLNDKNSVKIGYTQNHQFLSMLSNTIAPTPIDFWKGADPYFAPQAAKSYFISYNTSSYKAVWESSIEAYYTTVDNVQEFKDFADLYGNQHLETDILFGSGKNYGVELSVVKNTGKLTGRMSYTYSRSLKQINRANQAVINDGKWYPTLVDKPHDLNLLLTYNFTRRLGVNVLFNYNTGQPVTIPVNRFSDWNAGSILYYGERNAYRLPDYHRLDLSFNLLPGYNLKRKVKTTWNFAIQNIYGRKNAYSLFFRQKPFEKVITYKYAVLGTILPAVTLNIEW
jgi:TonB dependent receptor/TonB-dependent Receptor Plug Domain